MSAGTEQTGPADVGQPSQLDPDPAPPSKAEIKYAWRVLSVTSLGALLTAVNASTLDVALPTVSRHFAATSTEASWFLLSYMLVNTVFILVFGRLADLIGRRRLYLLGFLVFTLASLGCGFAPNAGVLIGLRAVQALGAASVITNTTALLVDAFPPSMLGVGLGMNVTVIAAAQISGPLLGGAMATFFGWRAVFLFNVPTGFVGIVWGMLVLRKSVTAPNGERFDVLSAVVSAFALGGVVVALSEGGALAWSDPLVLFSAAVAAIALPLFIWMQRRRRDPLIDLKLFYDRTRAAAYLSSFASNAARFAVVLVISIYLQAANDFTAFQAGVRVMPTALGMLIASPISGRLIRRVGSLTLSRFGLALSAVSVLIMALTLSRSTSALVIGAELLGLGLGTGLFLPANTNSIMVGVSPDRRGVANGIRSMLQNTGTVVGTALCLALATTWLAPNEKRAAYAGTLGRVSGRSLEVFTDGCRLALFALFGLCVLAAVVQWGYKSRTAPEPATQST